MPQNRILYNVQDIYVGPAKDDQAVLLSSTHMLQRLYRVQSFDYSIELNRNKYKELGKKGTIFSKPIESPDISFEFDYLIAGISNEVKVGIDANWNITGQYPMHTNPSGVCIFSGFLSEDRDYDRRNFYLSISPSGIDGHAITSPPFATGYSGWNIYDFIDQNSRNYHVASFVNSYLVGLNYDAQIGDFPRAKLSYVADNIVYYPSGSGFHIPKVNASSPTGIFSSFKGAIPRHYRDNMPAALKPGDITFSLSGGDSLSHLGMSIEDAKLQSFSISVPVSREKLSYLGNFFPVDRPITFPIDVNLNLEYIAGDLIKYTTITGGYSQSPYSDSYLNSNDGAWYGFRLIGSSGIYYIDLDQSPSSPGPNPSYNWVLNCADDGLNYRVGLITDAGITSFTVDQVSTGVAGSSYKEVWATDNTLHRFYLSSGAGDGFVTWAIDSGYLSIPQGTFYSTAYNSGNYQSLDTLLREDYEYDASVRINNSLSNPMAGQHLAILYNLKKAKINSISYNSSINGQRVGRISMQTEIDPDDLSRGFFISGIFPSLSTDQTADTLQNKVIIKSELMTEDALDILITEDSDPVAAEDIIYTPNLF